MSSVLSLCAVLLSLDAHAVAPTDTQGHEPVRVRTTTGQGQAAFQRTPAWRGFLEEAGDWHVRADERTGTPHRMWGEGVDLGALATEADVELALRDLIDRHPELFGARGDLPLRSVAYDPDFDAWYADFDAVVRGVPVWRAGVTFRIKHDRLVMAGADTYPRTPVRGDFQLQGAQALQAAIAFGPAAGVPHTDTAVRPVWLPRMEEGLLVLRATYEVRSRTEIPRGDWVVFVDGESGRVLDFYNEVRFVSGTVFAENDIRFPGGGTEVSPVRGAAVTNGNSTVYTGANGDYTIANGGSYQTHFLGDPVYLQNQLGNQGLNFTGSNPSPTWNAGNGSMAEIDTWVHTHRVRDTFNAVVPSVSWTYGDTNVYVNINDACNAYYDGTLNFFQSGQGCNNTGRISDVVYHEWGHGLHDHSLVSGYFDGALSEGAGDTVAFLMTGDANMAPGFFSSGGYLRTADNDRRYPQDLVDEVHEDGLIFAGAMWDTYVNIENAQGNAAAVSATRSILAGLLKGGPGLADSLEEALFADDDDGSLANGTPHECQIVAGFADHGLGQLGDDVGFVAGHEPIAAADPSTPHAVAVNIVGPASCANDFGNGTATVTWRANGGPWQDTGLVFSGLDASGAIPAQPFGTFVEYYVTVNGGGETLTAPTHAWRNPFGFYVGGVIPVRCDDFEASDGGYVHELLAGQPGDGADDWQHGAPGGVGGDPAVAHGGTKVWGNDLGVGNFNGLYQDDKHNRLTGPVVQLGHYEQSFLHYWRWLNVEDGVYDHASILANGAMVWTNVAGNQQDHHQDDQWAPHAVSLGNPAGSVQIAFDLETDGGLGFGGWTIDDVCILAPATPNNRLGVVDFVAGEGENARVRLSWTNPVHAPLTEVRVVRQRGYCPSNVFDGDVVYYDNQPVLGASIEAFDPVPTTDTYCYGVFPGDGSDFLGFVVEGWNLDEGSALTPATPEEIDDAKEENGLEEFEEDQVAAGADPYARRGCGCDAGGGLATGLWVLGLLPWIRRRPAR
ncbi:MAG: hypothetical protein R3F61_25950 [Myxococcota bacterium]